MENIFSFDVFLINIPIYIAFIIVGFMIAIKPKREKQVRLESFSDELSKDNDNLKTEKFEDFEMYLKLASLFRKSGEFDKAVRLHTKLLEQNNITKPLESTIIFELGIDYLSSGLFDKAEENLLLAYSILDKKADNEKDYLLALSSLYERQKEWSKSLTYRKKLVAIDSNYKSGLALLLCNIAEEEKSIKNIGNAKKLYQDALVIDSNCVLAAKELSNIFIAEEKFQETFDLVKQYSENSTHLLNLLSFAFEKLVNLDDYKEQTAELLAQLVEKKNCDYEIAILYCNYLLNIKNNEELNNFIDKYNDIYKNNLQAIYDMALFLKDTKFDYKSKNHDNVLMEKVEDMLKNEYRYQCTGCGYHTKQEFWHCPQCQKWNTIDRINR